MWDIDEIAAIIGGIHRSLAGFQDIRTVFGQLREVFFGTEHKHAAVPVVLPGGEVDLGALAVRLLHEAGHLVRGVGAVGERHAALDVAVAGFRGVRHDTEGDREAHIPPHHYLPGFQKFAVGAPDTVGDVLVQFLTQFTTDVISLKTS